jgi:hypothetical protein|uniref:Uncharacterized protein n=1 Tax=Populus trichocarpa TaxID=3694 RepID=U5G8K6_POPTR
MASMEEIVFEGINRNTTLEMVSTEAKSEEVILEEEDVLAEAAIYLGSDDSMYVSRVNFVIDEGLNTINRDLKKDIKELVS